MKKYKAVSGPKNVSVVKGDIQSGFNLFADIINREATDGWEYHSMENLTITDNPGCLQKSIPTNHYMLIFVKEV